MNDAGKVEEAQPPQAALQGSFPVVWEDPADAQSMWFFGAAQVADATTPLDFDLRARHLYETLNKAYRLYGMPLSLTPKRINTYAYYRLKVMIEGDDLTNAMQKADETVRQVARDLASRWETTWLPEIKTHIQALSAFDLPSADFGGLLHHFADLKTRVVRLWELQAYLFYPMALSISEFEETYRDLFPDSAPMDAFDLLAGFPTKTTEGNIRLSEMARMAARSAALRETIAATAPEALPEVLSRTSEGRDLWGALSDYLSTYGERTDNQSIDTPSWIEHPTQVLRRFRQSLLQADKDLAEELHHQTELRQLRLAEARAKLASHPRVVVDEFETALKAAQTGTFLSEEHNFWIDCKISYHARRVCLEIGKRLSEQGSIDRKDDIFYLTTDEISALADHPEPSDLRDRIAERRAEVKRFTAITPPPFVGTPAPPPMMNSVITNAIFKFSGGMPPPSAQGELRGMPGSHGLAKGPARVVRTLEEAEKLQPGEILVAPFTLPTWTPFFSIAAGVVTNAGGVLCHAAVVAREYGIPAVVGTLMATQAIRDGQVIEVDGDAGIVRLGQPAA